jgi:TolB-like protein/predicted Ser/Thr protein kinase/tetratricopeptide (TPR) repeat protein
LTRRRVTSLPAAEQFIDEPALEVAARKLARDASDGSGSQKGEIVPVAIPERIGRYRVDRELGRGGMGVVYAAYDEQLERPVAIKTIAEHALDEQARKRFQREARTAACIRHPNVCHIYEIGEDGDELFIAMEFLEGESLAERLARGSLPIREAVEISLAILSALDELHGAGVVHRDLKPSNFFLTPHGVRILDFGLARAAPSGVVHSQEATTSGLTQAGAIVGTMAYMAPEQIQGELVDARTDLFAMGAVIFEMIMGSRAFPGRTPMEVYHRTLYEQPPALGGSPAAIAADRVIRRALAKRPEDRYARACEMAEALRALREIEDTGVTRAHAITRLIVLPFRVLRPDPDTDFLAVSLPDAITGALTGLESLVVRSSAAAARFAGDELDFRRLAEEADVDVVLTGSLLRAGPQVRVTAQLVEVPGGTLLWSHAPQVSLRDVFQLQDQIVDRIVESLSLSLTAREHRSLKTDVPASPTAYEFFLRGNQLILAHGVTSAEHLYVAREFYERCVQEDPRYAPGWARLGRCHWLIGKGGDDPDENVRRAEASFERALELNPELPLALNLHALLEIDQGRAQNAMVRLLARARSGSCQPELYAALVQACRFCGLLEASVAAHERAQQLDRNILTSVDHAWWHLRDYDRALEYVKRRHYGEVSITNRTMRAVILSEQGRKDEAILQFREIEQAKLTEFFRDFVCMHRALHEGRREESLGAAERLLVRALDSDTLWQVARVLAYFGERARALAVFNLSLERGFILYRILTREDPWLDALRSSPEFGDLLRRAESRYREASAAFQEGGGEQLLGVGPGAGTKDTMS